MTDDEWEQQRRQALTNRAHTGWMTLPGQRSTPGTFSHGTRYGYDRKKCRCTACIEWHRNYKRQRYETLHPNATPRPKARKS